MSVIEGYPLAGIYEDRPGEECGVIGVYAPGEDVARLAHLGNVSQQHRGQDAAGIVVANGEEMVGHRGLGLVSDAFPEGAATVQDVPTDSYISIGHTRYGTSATSTPEDAVQPQRGEKLPNLALAHNGHIENINSVSAEYGMGPDGTDSQQLTRIIDRRAAELGSVDLALAEVLAKLEGAFSLVISDGKRLIATRDPWGIRPLVIGKYLEADTDSFMIASETPALDITGATFVRTVEPGEIVTIDEGVPTSSFIGRTAARSACMFEPIYVQRPDGRFEGRKPVNRIRKDMGQELALEERARENPIEADVVIGVPDSGNAFAAGFANAYGIPQQYGFYKSPYVHRTFIARTQEERIQMVRSKFQPIQDEVEGKRIVLIDDSIIRGTTMQSVVAMLYREGAKEVHLRIASPPYKNPCYYGMDTGNPDKLLASKMTKEEMCEYLGADSLEFLSVEGVEKAIALPVGSLCTACATGNYPTPGVQQRRNQETGHRLDAVPVPVNLGMPAMRKRTT